MPTQSPTYFAQATENLLDRIDCNPNDRETVRQFLIEFAEHILMHTTPASGNTIKRFQGLTPREIALALPDMEIEP